MKITKKMIPGQPGTKKWLEKYGDALICVRYRDDHQSQRRLKTIELVVESVPLKINKNTIPMNKIMYLRIGYHEKHLQNIVKGAGGRWNKQKQAWELAYKETRLLGLENRIIRKMANNRNIKSRSPP